MNNSQFPAARSTGLVVQDVPGEVLVYDLESDKAHCLNQTSAMVWKACDGKTSVTDIASSISLETGKPVSDDLIWLAIDQLNENNLLEREIRSSFAGESRRQVLKKIGLAAVVAMPLIASLAAPTSVLASTSCLCTAANPGTGDIQCSGQAGCGAICQCNLTCGSTPRPGPGGTCP